MAALDLAREHMASTGLDGYTLAVLMECEPKCWQDVTCTTCGRRKARIGRSSPLGAYECDIDCEGFTEDPKPPHLWSENDSARCYTDLLFDLRYRAGEFDDPVATLWHPAPHPRSSRTAAAAGPKTAPSPTTGTTPSPAAAPGHPTTSNARSPRPAGGPTPNAPWPTATTGHAPPASSTTAAH